MRLDYGDFNKNLCFLKQRDAVFFFLPVTVLLFCYILTKPFFTGEVFTVTDVNMWK